MRQRWTDVLPPGILRTVYMDPQMSLLLRPLWEKRLRNLLRAIRRMVRAAKRHGWTSEDSPYRRDAKDRRHMAGKKRRRG